MTAQPIRLDVFDSPQALGLRLAAEIAELIEATPATVLGCPAGRTPRPVYRALAQIAADRRLDLSQLRLVMMDDYAARVGDGWSVPPMDAHYSCARFAELELRVGLNAGLPAGRRIPAEHVLFPDPNEPSAYEATIAHLGGIDLFILASGASDGHVAFNPPGTPAGAGTRIVELAETTRRDNLATFPDFKALEETPRHGVTVGPGTIARHARKATLVLTGAEKGLALSRVMAVRAYDPQWPASVVHACAEGVVLADRAAVEAAERLA
jgi:glucosamine-6-phosphate deaminase